MITPDLFKIIVIRGDILTEKQLFSMTWRSRETVSDGRVVTRSEILIQGYTT